MRTEEEYREEERREERKRQRQKSTNIFRGGIL